MSLTPDQVQIIKATVPVLKEHGNAITTLFYATMLKENPELNNIFNQANQSNNHQPQALAASLYAYASYIDDLGVLSPAVEKICQKHVSLYIRPEHYDIVGTYLLRAMGEVLGAALTPDVLEAWGQAYWQLANIMIKREDSLYKECPEWTTWRAFKIAQKTPESSEITSFYLEPVDGKALPSFLPGQYISVQTSVPSLDFLQSRQYSLSDAPNPNYYRISVKKDPGLTIKDVHHPAYISNILHAEKEVGDVVEVSHPAGEFFCDPKAGHEAVVLISAGVGLTPMISILNTLTASSSSRNISWIHATRSTETQAFGKEIKAIVEKNENVKAVVFNKQPASSAEIGVDYKFATRFDLAALDKEKDLCCQDKKAVYYVCGPRAFMLDVKSGLQGFGIGEDRIKLEVFGTGMSLA